MVKYGIWAGSYMTCGITCFGIGILYSIFVGRDLQSLTPKLPGYKSSQITFIIASLIRGGGWISFAGLIIHYQGFNLKQYYSPLLIGIPGYILTVSYALLFYLWSSICVNLIANDSTTGLKETFKSFVTIILTIIATLACGLIVITIVAVTVLGNETKDSSKDFYTEIIPIVEGSLAVIRDFATGLIILFFTLKIIKMLQKPLFSSKPNESIYCWMLFCLTGALFIRCISIIIFLIYHRTDENGCSGNYINTFITAILAELIPCFMIFFTRRRSGPLSVYDLIE